MEASPKPESPEVLAKIYTLFRDYFDRAEKKRRWNIAEDIPWDQCNPGLDPAIADVVATFCAVELYLPDYLSKLIPQVRANRGRAWMLANWGYEECKHSMALGDWLLRSRHFTDEQMFDLETEVFQHEWDLPHDNARGMVCYTMVQELATQMHYRNLRRVLKSGGGDPALDKALLLIAVDEAAHADFFRKLVQIYLEDDRPGTLEQMRRVFNTFKMPAVHMLFDGRRRMAAVQELGIFDEQTFVEQVYEPLIRLLGVEKRELRRRQSPREVVVLNSPV
jgi:acyl-[acyl-carrier-protein] desaturase